MLLHNSCSISSIESADGAKLSQFIGVLHISYNMPEVAVMSSLTLSPTVGVEGLGEPRENRDPSDVQWHHAA
jgi:hypothetical protein